MAKSLRALGGNIFAGLFTVGVKQAGYEVLGHLEHGPYGVATAQLNHPELAGRVWQHPSVWPAPRTFGRVNLMFCNPPCAAWSSARASKKTSWEDHTARLAIIDHLTTYGITLKPDAWVWESVTNAWRHGRGFLDRIAAAWMAAGYHVTVVKQNNMYLGVPQNRPRILVTAHRYPLVFPPLTPVMSFTEAVKGLRATAKERRELALEPGNQELWERCANMSNDVRRAWEVLTVQEQQRILKDNATTEQITGYRGKPSFMTSRIYADRPMNVLLSAFKRWHPREPRLLTWAEMLRMCGLPPTWQATCAYGPASHELSRAVMPPVGAWLARAVADGIATGKRLPRRPTYVLHDVSAGPEHVSTTEQLAAPDHRFGDLRRWDQEPAPPPKRTRTQTNATPREAGGAPRPVGSGAFIRERLRAGDTTEAILAQVHARFPGSKATASDVSWNRGRLKREEAGS